MLAVAIVADDLTGAFDAAAPFAERAVTTKVACRPTALASALEDSPAVLSVNAATRHVAPEVAARTVGDICRNLVQSRPRLLFKKIDSTLRGNVVVETLAALDASGRKEVILTPAIPSQGRTMRAGIVHVGGVALPATPFVHDAVTPASPVPLVEQFRALAPGVACAVVGAAPPPKANERRIYLADAEIDDDLARIAAWAEPRLEQALLVGSAGLGNALAQRLYGAPRPHPRPVLGTHAILFVVGSQSTVSDRQAAWLLARDHNCALLLAPAGRLDPAATRAAMAAGARDLLARVPPEPADDPAIVAGRLGRAVADLVRGAAIGALVMTGGDTAQAVLESLARPVVTLVGELRPGIPLSSVRLNQRTLWLVTKAGGFGTDDLFAEIPGLLGSYSVPRSLSE